MRFQDQVVIVTGGSLGIGRAYVRAFHAEGAKVVIADVADPGEFLDEFEGGACVYVETDIRREESTLAMAESTLERFGRIDVLINNAARPGRTARWPLMDIKLEDWDEVYRVNVRGTLLCTRAVVPAFDEAGRGKIVNIASDSFYKGHPGMLAYVSSKGAVIAMTRSLSKELGPLGVNVNAVAPDWIPLGPDKDNPPPYSKAVLESRVFKRHMDPEDAVGAVLFLASSESEFITGITLPVSGGSYFV
jgi:NAD(P)-dependent dehydrogenase (short-subunit alcohol dehydrogenase family)